jgi:hypothetical protein
MVMKGEKEDADPGGRASSDASAFRGTVTALRGSIGSTAHATAARPASATILSGGLAGPEERQRKPKNEPEEILGQKWS